MKFKPVNVTLKNGKVVLLREALEEDAQIWIDSMRAIVATTDMLTVTHEYEPNLERQKGWLRYISENRNVLNVIAIHDNIAAGNISLSGSTQPSKCDLTGRIAMSAMEERRGIGLGFALIENVIKWVRTTTRIEILWLEVFGSNAHAIALYNKAGFEENGRIKDFYIQPSGRHEDSVYMSLRLK